MHSPPLVGFILAQGEGVSTTAWRDKQKATEKPLKPAHVADARGKLQAGKAGGRFAGGV